MPNIEKYLSLSLKKHRTQDIIKKNEIVIFEYFDESID